MWELLRRPELSFGSKGVHMGNFADLDSTYVDRFCLSCSYCTVARRSKIYKK